MKRFLFLLIVALALAGFAGATSVCTGPTTVISLNCTVGGLTFSNFQIIAAAGNPAPEVDLVSANVAGDGSVTLTFNPNMSAAPGGGAQDLYLYYQIAGTVNQVSLGLAGANATIMETACSSNIASTGPSPNVCPAGTSQANLLVFSQQGLNSATSVVFKTPPQNLYIFKDIAVSPTAPSKTGGAIASFTQSYVVAGGSAGSEVPEPMTLMLLGSGLVAVGLLRHRTRTE